jgi:DNA repair protein RecO (recombination protein O)
MRVSLTPSFILHHRHYRETSLTLDIFSREYGRLSLVAKGVRSNRKKNQALFQAHRNLNISWSGRGEMGTLTEIEANGPGFELRGEALIAAFYLNELLIRLLHKHESHPELFDAYLIALTRLKHGESEFFALRYFEKQLLDALGYGLILDHEIESGQAIDPDKEYFYSIDRGPYERRPANSTCVKIAGKTLLALDHEAFDKESAMDEVKQVMRLTLNGYLGEKPLESRELYRAYMIQKIR